MRVLLFVLALACLFGIAALWHADRIAAAKAAQLEARHVADGSAARTEAGLIPDGYGVLVLGKPSGVEAPKASAPVANPNPVEHAPTPETSEPADFQMVVENGQSLSKIAKAHYGTANAELVKMLARYNGLASVDALKLGQKLALPSAAKLEAFRATLK